MITRGRVLAALLAGLLGLSALIAAAPAHAAAPHHATVSFTRAQEQFNCTICHEPLYEAHSAEAYQENALLRQLIRRGDTMAQIRHVMVANYGIGVLANPPKRGFAVLIVVVPVAVIALGVLLLAYTIPRWRRRAAEQARAPRPDGPPISDADRQRLAADLARGD